MFNIVLKHSRSSFKNFLRFGTIMFNIVLKQLLTNPRYQHSFKNHYIFIFKLILKHHNHFLLKVSVFLLQKKGNIMSNHVVSIRINAKGYEDFLDSRFRYANRLYNKMVQLKSNQDSMTSISRGGMI